MIFLRMAGTPPEWQPDVMRTSRWTHRKTVLPLLTCLAFGLAALPVGPVILAHEVPLMFEPWGSFSLVPFAVALVPIALSAFLLWLGVGELFQPDAFLEIDHATRRILVVGMRGTLPAQQVRGNAWIGSLDDVSGLGTQVVDEHTMVHVVNRGRRYLRTEQVERLVELRSGRTLWSDRPLYGRVGEIGRTLATLTGRTVVRLPSAVPAPSTA